jgi:hypothetical protein
VLCGGIAWWVRSIMCREVWSVWTSFVCGILWWVRDIICRKVWSSGTCFVCGGFYGGLEM